MKITSLHEFIHKYSGPGTARDLDIDYWLGYRKVLPRSKVSIGDGLNEAVTEHLAHSILGNENTLKGGLYSGYDVLNTDFGKLMELTSQNKNNPIDFNFMVDNFFDSNIDVVRNKFDSVYGENFFDNYIIKGFDEIYNDKNNRKTIQKAFDIISDVNGVL